jgi:hypothetical protein
VGGSSPARRVAILEVVSVERSSNLKGRDRIGSTCAHRRPRLRCLDELR